MHALNNQCLQYVIAKEGRGLIFVDGLFSGGGGYGTLYTVSQEHNNNVLAIKSMAKAECSLRDGCDMRHRRMQTNESDTHAGTL